MAHKRASMFFNLTFMLSFVLLAFLADGKRLGIGLPPRTLVCSNAYGAESGDTCFNVAQGANLTAEVFATLNPNLNCSHIFVGEWLCISGFKR